MSTGLRSRRFDMLWDPVLLEEVRHAAADSGMTMAAWVKRTVAEKLHPQGTLEALVARGAAVDVRELEAVVRHQAASRPWWTEDDTMVCPDTQDEDEVA